MACNFARVKIKSLRLSLRILKNNNVHLKSISEFFCNRFGGGVGWGWGTCTLRYFIQIFGVPAKNQRNPLKLTAHAKGKCYKISMTKLRVE